MGREEAGTDSLLAMDGQCECSALEGQEGVSPRFSLRLSGDDVSVGRRAMVSVRPSAILCYETNRSFALAYLYGAGLTKISLRKFSLATFFGMIIAIIGCYHGLTTTGGAEGVGKSTTRAVVLSLMLILVSDFFLTVLILSGRP